MDERDRRRDDEVPIGEDAPDRFDEAMPAPEAEGQGEADGGDGGKVRRSVVVVGVSAAVVACLGLGLALCNGLAEPQPEQGAPVEQAAEAPEGADEIDATSVELAVSGLAFAGEDVSVTDPSAIEVEVAGGRVWVLETSEANAVGRIDSAARRSAALAGQLGDSATDVTWAVAVPGSEPSVAVTNSTASAATEMAGEREPADDAAMGDATGDNMAEAPGTAEVVEGSDGWKMDGATHEEAADAGVDVPQEGGEAPTRPDGSEAVPAPDDEAEETDGVDGADAPGGDSGASGSGAEPASTSQPSGGSGAEPSHSGEGASSGGGSSSDGSQATAPSQPSGGSGSDGGGATAQPSKPAHTHDWQPAYGTRWVQDKAAWDETAVVTPAWDEPIYDTVSKIGCTSCGAKFDSVEAWGEHSSTVHDDEASYSSVNEKVQTGTKHHDAVTKVVHHDAVGHDEQYVTGYTCSCGATK